MVEFSRNDLAFAVDQHIRKRVSSIRLGIGDIIRPVVVVHRFREIIGLQIIIDLKLGGVVIKQALSFGAVNSGSSVDLDDIIAV